MKKIATLLSLATLSIALAACPKKDKEAPKTEPAATKAVEPETKPAETKPTEVAPAPAEVKPSEPAPAK